MVGSSVLPACIHKGKLYFLFGEENSLADTPGWSDFGGGVDPGENVLDTAMREGAEEMTGFLGPIAPLVKKNGGTMKLKSPVGEYYIHLFHLPYTEELPTYYNFNHDFLWRRMNKKMLNGTKLFEKARIKWWSVDEMRSGRSKFRDFYRDIVDMLCSKEKDIIRFLRGRRSLRICKKGMKKCKTQRFRGSSRK